MFEEQLSKVSSELKKFGVELDEADLAAVASAISHAFNEDTELVEFMREAQSIMAPVFDFEEDQE